MAYPHDVLGFEELDVGAQVGGGVDLVAVLLQQVQLHLGDVEAALRDREQTLAVLNTEKS